VLPRTHETIVRLAVSRAHSAWSDQDLAQLIEGHLREDDHVLFGLRFRAAGLTHTYRPGRRFGELFTTNAKTKMLGLIHRASRSRSRARAAHLVGRACHLLGDMAVPARTRGVWHLAGDPLEAWLEERSDDLASLVPESIAILDGDPGAIADALARASAIHDADTTRTPWGRALFERFGRGTRLDADALASQAEAILPLAVASTAALLRAVAPP
jgi:hypothetical protein